MIRTALSLLLSLTLVQSTLAEVIRSFDVDIRAYRDASLDVTETIVMDFESAEKHGIYRIIPIRYERYMNSYTIKLRVQSVTDAAGNSHKYSTDTAGGDLSIKIGDPNVKVTGQVTYRIQYHVRRAVNFLDEGPEVYWNVTGNEWPYWIDKTSARFYPPEGVKSDAVRTASYRGRLGSKQSAKIEVMHDHILYTAGGLPPAQGLTMVAGLPPGSIEKPTLMQEVLWFLRDWWPALALPLITCGFMFWKWRTTGRDEGDLGAVPVEWNPPDKATPAEVGTLLDEKADMNDLVATLVDLAARGHLTIRELESEKFLFMSNSDYEFERAATPPSTDTLLPHEHLFLNGIFSEDTVKKVKLSSLKEKFYRYLDDIRKSVYHSLITRQYFRQNPETVRTGYSVAGVMMLFFSLFAMFAFGGIGWISVGVGLVISGLIVLTMARAMPARTKQGVEALRQVLGFQRFVTLTEAPRIRMMANDDPTVFGRLLPYAMVLGVADKWADAFADLLKEPPDWYRSRSYRNGFSSHRFLNDLGRGLTVMSKTFTSQPKQSKGAGSGRSGFSSGGGFSGGGFGGGGGRSW